MENEVGWVDSQGSRPAFVRIQRAGGTMRWAEDGGELRLMLTPDPEALRALDPNPRSGELYGDRDVSSDHPLVPNLGISVELIMIEWAQPEPDQIRFCG